MDDETVVTQSLAAFLDLETDYRVRQSQSPHEALSLLRESPVDVVISDFLMPEMNGIEFLLEVRKLYPEIPRIMLTGYADKENTIRAINEVGLFQYIEKPWDNDQMLLVVKSAVANKGLRASLTERIRELDSVLLAHSKLSERDEQLREELSLACELQRSLLPDLSRFSGQLCFSTRYEPSLDIGGDFYDVIPLSNNRKAVLLADATGHGIQAALSTAVVKFAFTSFTNYDVSPTDIVTGMNQVLTRGLPAETFVAALVAVIEPDARRVHILNAGIPHPFVLRRSTEKVERVRANGFILGVVDESLYPSDPEVVLEMDAGDMLVLHTDGIGDAVDSKGVQFDDALMKELLLEHRRWEGDKILGALIKESRTHAHPGHDWDDITIVGVELR
ncbi:MAG: SpoIIE family protein phosphatase [bacterium]|nr:SpoIIE family protein phosphatase [bacterium]